MRTRLITFLAGALVVAAYGGSAPSTPAATGDAPDGAAAEPSGVVFDDPVELSFRLPEGLPRPVMLLGHDPDEGVFALDGLELVDDKDGVVLKGTTMHFSSFAAVKALLFEAVLFPASAATAVGQR